MLITPSEKKGTKKSKVSAFDFFDLSDSGIFYSRISGVCLYTVDSVLACSHGLVSFAYADDLTIGCLETEPDLTFLVLEDLELWMFLDLEALYCLILNSSFGSILLDASHSL